MIVFPARDPESTEIGIYLFAQDVLDEGADAVANRLQTAGIGRLVVAAAYHHARDVVPHNPRRRFVYHEGGVVYFKPDRAKYGRLRPAVSKLARRAPIQRLIEAAHRRGMSVDGWVVSLHNSRLGARYSNHCQVTAVGGSLLHALCPANPEVRQFAQALAADTVSLGVDGIDLETLCYQPFEHGSHHERSVFALDGFVRFLLGLCFCRWCLERAGRGDVDGERLRRFVAAQVDGAFRGTRQGPTAWPSNEEDAAALCDGDMGRYLAVRQATVAGLVHEIAGASRSIAPAVRITYLDPSAAVLGYATGRPSRPEAAATTCWQHGIDPRLIVGEVDELGVPAYFADRTRFRREIEAYQDLCPDRVKVILRPMLPDVRSRGVLAQRMRTLRDLGINRVSFYHYGLMPLESLDWIRATTRLGSPPSAVPPWHSQDAHQGTAGLNERLSRRPIGERASIATPRPARPARRSNSARRVRDERGAASEES